MISVQHYRVSIRTFNIRTCSNIDVKYLNKYDSTLVHLLLITLLMLNMLSVTCVQKVNVCTTAIGWSLNTMKSCQVNDCVRNRAYLSHKNQNKLVHMLEGNKNRKGYKLSQWNCGSAFLENKMPELEAAVARVKPTIFCVSKSNLRSSVDHNSVQIPGYNY